MNTSLVVHNDFEIVENYSKTLIRSPQTRADYRSKEAAFYIIQKALELGLPPILGLEQINFIKGKCAMSVECLMALVYKSGKLEDIIETTTGEFPKDDYTVTCRVKRKDMKSYMERSFSIKDAKQAGLWKLDRNGKNISGKDLPWAKYPKRMLEKRVYGWTMRDAFPDVVQGLYTNEEAQDLPNNLSSSPIAVEKPSKKKQIDPPKEVSKKQLNTASALFEKVHSLFENEDEWSYVDDFIDYICGKSGAKLEYVLTSAIENTEKFILKFNDYKKKQK
jgi:hypothetical protein